MRICLIILLTFFISAPTALSSPPTEKDILLTTHSHGDHLNTKFADAFPGKQLRFEKGESILPDVSIRSIQGAHNSTPPPDRRRDLPLCCA